MVALETQQPISATDVPACTASGNMARSVTRRIRYLATIYDKGREDSLLLSCSLVFFL